MHLLSNRRNVLWSRTTATTNNVQEATLSKFADDRSCLLWGFIVFTKFVWQARIRVSRNVAIGFGG